MSRPRDTLSSICFGKDDGLREKIRESSGVMNCGFGDIVVVMFSEYGIVFIRNQEGSHGNQDRPVAIRELLSPGGRKVVRGRSFVASGCVPESFLCWIWKQVRPCLTIIVNHT